MKKSILSLLIFSFILCGCKNTAPLSNKEFCLDTIIQITLYDSSSKNILNNCFDLCKKYERIFSTNNKKSELYKINHSSNKLEAQELSNRLQQIASYERWNNNNSYEMHFNPFYRFLSRIINLNVFASNVAKTIDEKCTYPSFKIANMSSKQAWILACAAIENNINLEDCYTPVWAR